SRLHFAAAALEAALGFFIMINPLERAIGLVALIGLILVLGGIVRLARSMVTSSHRRGWIIMAGVVSLLLGLCLLTGWPDSKLCFVGRGITLDFGGPGASWSARGLAERRPAQEQSA